MERVAERLRERRAELGLTQKEAAEQLGCHPNSYRLWELGAQEPKGAKLKRVAEWLGIDADTMLELLAASKLASLARAS